MKTKFFNSLGRGYLKLEFSILSPRYRVNKGSFYILDIGFLKENNTDVNKRMDV